MQKIMQDSIYKWNGHRLMPAHKLGRLGKFEATEIDEWIRKGKAADSNLSTEN